MKTTANTVTVLWNEKRTGSWWNETCAMVLEVFGLPGKRYSTHPDTDYMSFEFKNTKDADLCRVLLSERLS
jgi:hypothetical protein